LSISDEQRDAASEYLIARQIAEELSYRFDVAEDRVQEIYDEGFLKAEGNIEERKCQARLTKEYLLAREEYRQARAAWKGHEHYARGATMICELWRSESANSRFVR
jgi:hypothetical protein